MVRTAILPQSLPERYVTFLDTCSCIRLTVLLLLLYLFDICLRSVVVYCIAQRNTVLRACRYIYISHIVLWYLTLFAVFVICTMSYHIMVDVWSISNKIQVAQIIYQSSYGHYCVLLWYERQCKECPSLAIIVESQGQCIFCHFCF